MADIEVVSKLTLDRSAWLTDLRGASADLKSTTSEMQSQGIALPVTVDDQITRAVEEIIADLQSREIVIPVRYAQMGDVPAGVGVLSNSRFGNIDGGPYNAQPPLASVPPGAAGDPWDESSYTTLASAAGVEAAVSPVVPVSRIGQENAANEARWAARSSTVESLLGPETSVGTLAEEDSRANWKFLPTAPNRQMGAMTEAEKLANFAQEIEGPNPDRYVPGMKDIESAEEGPLGEAGVEGESGGKSSGPKLLNRFVAMELARIPIEHLEEQISVRSKLDDAMDFGSTSQQRKADEEVLKTDSSGIIGQISRPWNDLMGYDPAGQLREMKEDDAVIARGELVSRAAQDTSITNLRTSAYETDDLSERGRLNREAQYQSDVKAATEKHAKKSEELSGADRAADERYKAAIAAAPEPGGIANGPVTQDSMRRWDVDEGMSDKEIADATAKANAAKEAAESQLSRDKAANAAAKKVIEDQFEADKADAQAKKDAGAREDQGSASIRGISDRYANAETITSAKTALNKTLGEGPDQALQELDDALTAKIKELTEKAKAPGLSTEEARKFQGQADALTQAKKSRIEAQQAKTLQEQEVEDYGIQHGTAALGIQAMRLQGDTLGADRAEVDQSAESQAHAAIEKYGKGQLDDFQLAETLANVKQAQDQGYRQADKNESLRAMRLRNETDESSIISPYQRQLKTLRDDEQLQELRDESHAIDYRRIESNKETLLNRRHDTQIEDMRGQAAETDLRTANKGGLADVFALQRKMKDELSDADGDPAAQSAIRAKYLSETKALEKKLTAPEHIASGSPTQMLLQSQQAIFDGTNSAKAVAAAHGLEQNIKSDQDRHGDDHSGAGPMKGLENAVDGMKKAGDIIMRAGQKILDAPEVFTVA